MPNAPKCPICLVRGAVVQMYKNWIKKVYQCNGCGGEIPLDQVSEIETKWKTDPEGWKVWRKGKVKEYKDKHKPKKVRA